MLEVKLMYQGCQEKTDNTKGNFCGMRIVFQLKQEFVDPVNLFCYYL